MHPSIVILNITLDGSFSFDDYLDDDPSDVLVWQRLDDVDDMRLWLEIVLDALMYMPMTKEFESKSDWFPYFLLGVSQMSYGRERVVIFLSCWILERLSLSSL